MSRIMKDSGIIWVGKIPQTWAVKPNKRVMTKRKKICNKYQGEDVLSLTMNGVIVRDLENPYGKMPLTFDGYQCVEEGNLLMCLFDIDVTPRCIGIINSNGLTSPAYSQFELIEGNVRYFYYYYLYLDYTKELLHITKSLRHTLTESQLGEIYIPYPSEGEQEHISNYLDIHCALIDYTIENQKLAIEKLKEYKQSIITEAVTTGLNPNVPMKDSGIEWIGEIPEHWNLMKFRYVISSIKSGTSVNASYYPAGNNEVGVLKTSCVYNYKFEIEENKCVNLDEITRVSCPVKGDTVIMSRMNTPELVGAAGYVDADSENIYLPDRLWQVSFDKNVQAKYAWYYLISKNVRKYFELISMGTSSSMQNITQGQLNSLPIGYPSIEEQNEITKYLDTKTLSIDNAVRRKELVIAKLESFRKSLIYECVTGKREVK